MVRLLLIWLLVLALPMQGVAAAAMQFCGASHGPQAQLLAAAAPDHAHAAHAQGHAHHVDAGDGAKPASTAQGMALAKFKCSACAACCMATALPPAAMALPVVEAEIETAAVVPAVYVGPDGPGLERPPKRHLA